VLAGQFDFMNGFHDAGTRSPRRPTGVLKRKQAWCSRRLQRRRSRVSSGRWAATGRQGHRRSGDVDQHVVFGALVGAIVWNVVTWWYGIPSSSSHALIGGIVGAVIAKAGPAR
jgi:PiT family inorganic phosphate transporter